MNKDYKTFKLSVNSEIVDFCDFFLGFKPHPYQIKFLNQCMKSNRVASLWPRQAGKSFALAAYIIYRVLMQAKAVIIVSPTQNQSNELYKKMRDFVSNHQVLQLMIKKDTATEMEFQNGGRIVSLPQGNEGKSIRGYTADIIVLEEAGVLNDKVVNQVVMPMIASKPSGQVIKIGTPLGKNHFYQSCYGQGTNYILIKITWRDCVEAGQYSQEFIDEQQRTLLEIEFRQEYEAEFTEDDTAFFKYELVKLSQQEDLSYLII